MNLKESLNSYVIFHGPPFVGKSSYFTSELSETYKRISPSELFQSNSALSLRQLINNYIIKPLLEGEKVVVDDSMQTMAHRRSYTSTVLNKIPKLHCTCLAFRPEFGKTQLLWKREILLAEAVLSEDWQSLERIFTKDIDVWYGKCEPLLDVEQLRQCEVTLPLQIVSRHPFLIPCLMIECSAVPDTAKVVDLMVKWSQRNKHGRIIAVYSSDRNSRNETEKSVLEFLKSVQLMSELVVCAYVGDVGSSGHLALLTASILAFLMRLHCLDLFSSKSVYLYESLKHRKMVESVGMRHIKLARALTNPDLLYHGTTQFPVPKMLQNMCVVLPPGEAKKKNQDTDAPYIPLLQKAVESDDCIAKVSVGNHRTIYIAARNVDSLNRYQQQMLEDSLPPPPQCVVDPSPSGPSALAVDRRKRLPSSSFKVLPSWMIRKRKRTPDQMPTDGASRPKIGRGRGGSHQPSTLYIMTEQELLKTATLILREGGSTPTVLEERDTSHSRSRQDRKYFVQDEKSEEGSSWDKRQLEKTTHINKCGTAEQRLSNVGGREQVQHTRTSQKSSAALQSKSPGFHSPDRLSNSSLANATRETEAISNDDITNGDVCQMFVEGVSASKSKGSSKNYRATECTREPQKTQLKSVHRKVLPEVVHNTNRQIACSSEDITNNDEMNFLNEVLTGHVSRARPCSRRSDVSATDTKLPSDKKSPKKVDSNISHFIDSLIS